MANSNSNPNNFKTTKEAMAFVRDFMNTPFEELVEKAENGEEGYGIMTDPRPETNTQRLLNSIEDAPDYDVEEETLSDPKDSYIFDLDNNLTTPNNC